MIHSKTSAALAVLAVVLATLLCAPPALPKAKTLGMTREKQKGTSLCWAAVSTMAMRSLPAFSCPANQVDEDVMDELTPLTQKKLVRLARSEIDRCTDFAAHGNRFTTSATDCASLDGSMCDAPGDFFLFEGTSTSVPDGNFLTEAHFAKEIFTRKRPVIIQWDYSAVDRTLEENQDLPTLPHWLIIVGYDNKRHMVRVFDPLPKDGVTETQPDRREQWIPYAAYLDPQIALGQPVVAVHKQEKYKLRAASDPEPPQASPANPDGYPELGVSQQVVQGILLQPIPVQTALEVTRGDIEQLGRRYEIFSKDGKRLNRKFAAAPAFPIVVLTTRQLMNAASRPEEFLVPQTSSLLVPVVDRSTREITGSFLYFRDRDGWKQGGYSNTQIANLLVKLRDRHASAERATKDFYLVSIPEQASFFVAHGFGADAMLASVDDDGAGSLLRAHAALETVVQKVEIARRRGSHNPR